MDLKHQTAEEAETYQVLRSLLTDLWKIERTLTTMQQGSWDAGRALHLVAIRTALSQLELISKRQA